MNWKLFIDDIKNPPDNDWIIARTSQKAIQLIKSLGFPTHISFDHDLGKDDDIINVVKWIVNTDLNEIEKGNNQWIPRGFSFYVHSMNPTGKHNIESILKHYLDFKFNKK